MKKNAYINEKIKKFNKKIYIPGDKSLSIRWVLLASQGIGKSYAYNLLRSADVFSALNAILLICSSVGGQLYFSGTIFSDDIILN